MNSDISKQKAIMALRSNPGIRVIDVRSADEYRRGHISGSINMPLSSLQTMIKQISNKSTPIFVCCQSGSRSSQAKKTLTAMGYTNVVNIGGLSGWKLTGR